MGLNGLIRQVVLRGASAPGQVSRLGEIPTIPTSQTAPGQACWTRPGLSLPLADTHSTNSHGFTLYALFILVSNPYWSWWRNMNDCDAVIRCLGWGLLTVVIVNVGVVVYAIWAGCRFFVFCGKRILDGSLFSPMVIFFRCGCRICRRDDMVTSR